MATSDNQAGPFNCRNEFNCTTAAAAPTLLALVAHCSARERLAGVPLSYTCKQHAAAKSKTPTTKQHAFDRQQGEQQLTSTFCCLPCTQQ
jgi:hypothetical protein